MSSTSNKAVYLVPEQKAAEILGVSVSWLQKTRSQGRPGPAYVKIGGAVRYQLSALEAFISANTIGAPSSSAKVLGPK
ncbi:MAG: helix-turn-helix domain-containing protein [Pseudomonadota bacterium]